MLTDTFISIWSATHTPNAQTLLTCWLHDHPNHNNLGLMVWSNWFSFLAPILLSNLSMKHIYSVFLILLCFLWFSISLLELICSKIFPCLFMHNKIIKGCNDVNHFLYSKFQKPSPTKWITSTATPSFIVLTSSVLLVVTPIAYITFINY